MRSCVLWSGLLALLAGAALGTGAPLDPKTRALDAKVEAYGQQTYVRKFEAGRPAKVIVVGKTAGFLGLYVFDPDGNCVAHDDEVTRQTPNDLAVQWVPRRTDSYTIEVKCLGRQANEFLLGVRQEPGS
jgi:hypothetical protein